MTLSEVISQTSEISLQSHRRYFTTVCTSGEKTDLELVECSLNFSAYGMRDSNQTHRQTNGQTEGIGRQVNKTSPRIHHYLAMDIEYQNGGAETPPYQPAIIEND